LPYAWHASVLVNGFHMYGYTTQSTPYAMQTLRCCSIVAHVHDEVIIEADPGMSLQVVCEQMGRTPPWATGLGLRADGFECDFYQKDSYRGVLKRDTLFYVFPVYRETRYTSTTESERAHGFSERTAFTQF